MVDIYELISEYIEKCSMPFNTADHFEEIDNIREQIDDYLDNLYKQSKRNSYDVFHERYLLNKKKYGTIDSLQAEYDDISKNIESCGDYYAAKSVKQDINFWNIINKKKQSANYEREI